MFQNYLRIALRNLQKNKWFSIINIIGLTIGITASLIIYVYISHELSYDDFHENADRVYRVTKHSEIKEGTEEMPNVPYPMIDALNSDFNTFEAATQYHSDDRPLAAVGHEKFIVDHAIFVDSSFFEVFSFKVLQGHPKFDMSQPNMAYLTESLAQKIFGEADPIGKSIKLRNKIDVEVVGILADPPSNSHLQFDMVISEASYTTNYMGFDMFDLTSWEMTGDSYAYVKLKPNATEEQVLAGFEALVAKYYDEDEGEERSYRLQPLHDIHFNQKLGSPSSINPTSLYALGIIGAFILLVACVNFINLSTALAVRKSKEVGVRKTLGAGRMQLVKQYLMDTFIVAGVSGILAVGIAERLIIGFNQFFDKQLHLDIFGRPDLILFVLIIIITVALLSGLYPAVVLSGYNPVKALKSNIHSQSKTSLFMRKGLIVVQFFISQILIISTIVIATQMDYFTSKPLGFDKDAVLCVNLEKNDEQTLQTLRAKLKDNPNVKNVSFALGPPISNNTFNTNFRLTSDDDQTLNVQIKPVDHSYLETYGIKLKYGRWFTEAEEKRAREIFTKKDADAVYILNVKAVKALGFNDPTEAIGVNITTGVNGISAPIVGIVEDFHLGSFHEEIMPAIMMPLPMFYYDTGIKVSTSDLSKTIDHVESVYTKLFPDNLFEYDFLDDEVREFYVQEQHTFILFEIFSATSIFISCLGLLGLISFIVSQRTKEVGVRKVLGASIFNIVSLFSKDFILLVVFAFVFSAPVAWYVMQSWLAEFAYQIDIKAWFFLLAIVISIFIAFSTIAYQSIRAAMVNPVDSLRDE